MVKTNLIDLIKMHKICFSRETFYPRYLVGDQLFAVSQGNVQVLQLYKMYACYYCTLLQNTGLELKRLLLAAMVWYKILGGFYFGNMYFFAISKPDLAKFIHKSSQKKYF